jgi:hypothetical protein
MPRDSQKCVDRKRWGLSCAYTNLKEVREYAEEKLRQQGYEVVSKEGKYNFRISVHGGRSNVSVHLPLIVPRQQLINPVDLVVGNTGEDIG